MKKAFNKEILRSITRSLSRFLAIILIVALGTGFYAGLRMTAPDMRLAADRYYDGTHLYDIRILSTLGLSDEDIDAFKKIEGVDTVMPSRQTDVVTLINGEQYTVRVSSLDTQAARASDTSDGFQAVSLDENYLNRPLLVSGSWPEKPGECVISADRVMNSPVEIGDTIQVLEGIQDIGEVLKTETFTLVGFVNSSYYSSQASLGTTSLGSGIIQQYLSISPDDFADDMPYTELFLTVKDAADAVSASDSYQDTVTAVRERVESISSDRERARYEELRGRAQSELDKARADFEQQRAEAEEQLGSAKRQLDEASQLLADKESELASGQREYEQGTAEFATTTAQGQRLLEEAYAELSSSQTALDAGRAELERGRSQLQAAWASWQEGADELAAGFASLAMLDPSSSEYAQLALYLANQEALLDASKSELDAQQAQFETKEAEAQGAAQHLAGAWAQYDAQRQQAQTQISSAQSQLDTAESQLASGREALDAGRVEYESGLASYEEQRLEADQRFADAEAELAEAQRQIDEIEFPTWYVMDRTKNVGAESFQSDAERVDQISQVFPFLFFLVAALVALTTMTRMVEEERMLIGTYKALGYGTGRIASKYLIYAVLASGLGSVIGIGLLSQILPAVIFQAYAIMYSIPAGPTPIDPLLALLAASLGIGVTLIATAAAVISSLREKPAALMLPRAPKPGKRILLERITPLWSRLSFSWKVTFRNIFRYKRRFFMTIIGIAGCTALLLTGLGLSDAINDIMAKQYAEIFHYNTSIRVDDDLNEEDEERVDQIIGDQSLVHSFIRVHDEGVKLVSQEGKEFNSSVLVPKDSDQLGSFISLRERTSQQSLKLNDEGVIISEKIALQLGVNLGDSLSFSAIDQRGNATGDLFSFRIGGITENYIGTMIYISAPYYEEVTGETLSYSTVLADSTTDQEGRKTISESLLAIEGVRTVGFNDESIESYQKMLSSVNSIVVLLVIAAAVLAFVVLYNLTNINITERQREIATLKVLGFLPREVDAYIYRETTLLTILGALFGLVLGVFMESYVVVTAEINTVMFGREIHLASFVIAFLLTIVFSVVVALSMRRKLARIDMVESLKSVE